MAIKPALNQFNGGEISPQLEGRFDWQKFNYSAKLCKNFIPLVEGSLKRRGGSRFITETDDIPSCLITFKITATNATSVYVVIDDGKYECTLVDGVFMYSASYDYGTDINYTIKAGGYGEAMGSEYIVSDKEISITLEEMSNPKTLTIKTEPESAICLINGVERKTITVNSGTTISYKVTYREGEKSGSVVVDTDKVLTVVVNFYVINITGEAASGTFTCDNGLYQVIALGGGGGAGGGSYGDSHKSTGGGGGSAAGYNGQMHLAGTYSYTTGIGGYGGKSGRHTENATDGGNGGSTSIGGVISLGGGYGGLRYRGKKGVGTGGAGGIATVYDNTAVLNSPTNGVAGNGSTGGKINLSGSYGNGGDGIYKQAGNSGKSSKLSIRYLGEYNE